MYYIYPIWGCSIQTDIQPSSSSSHILTWYHNRRFDLHRSPPSPSSAALPLGGANSTPRGSNLSTKPIFFLSCSRVAPAAASKSPPVYLRLSGRRCSPPQLHLPQPLGLDSSSPGADRAPPGLDLASPGADRASPRPDLPFPELDVAGRRFSIGGRWSLSRARGSADVPPPSRSPSPARHRGAMRRRSSSGSRTPVPGSRTPGHLPRRRTAPPPRLHCAFRSRLASATVAPPQATVPSRAAAPFAPPRHALHRLQRPRLCRATRPPARPAGGPASASPCHQATRTVPPSHRCKGLQRDGWALSSKRMDPSCCSILLCFALLCLVLLCSAIVGSRWRTRGG